MALKGFGPEGQQRLLQSGVLVVGAGGLGCSALMHLAGAGIGRLGIMDHDIVSLENLHRQTLYGIQDIGGRKTEAAARRLREMNPEVEILGYPFPLSSRTCLELFPLFDVILDCTDNFPTRYMVNDACVLTGRPLVSAAVSRYEGQLAVFNLPGRDGGRPVHYRDLLPTAPAPGTVANCSEEGILGTLPGMMGAMQAGEAIKILAGVGEPLSGRILTYSMKDNSFAEFTVSRTRESHPDMPADIDAFLEKDYGSITGNSCTALEIGAGQMEEFVAQGETLVIDVRETGEQPALVGVEHLQIPLSKMEKEGLGTKARRIVFVCQSGVRSLQAARSVSGNVDGPAEAYSLKGGVSEWMRHKKERNV